MKSRLRVLRYPAALFALCGSFGAVAQDPVAVDPAHHKVEFENNQVRVLRITFKPGESSQMHSHPCGIAIGLNDSSLTFHLPDGTTRPANLKQGQVVVVKPIIHKPENRVQNTAEVILVELKSGGC